jgi:hypothetical protein
MLGSVVAEARDGAVFMADSMVGCLAAQVVMHQKNFSIE